jgi:hypothetical protein
VLSLKQSLFAFHLIIHDQNDFHVKLFLMDGGSRKWAAASLQSWLVTITHLRTGAYQAALQSTGVEKQDKSKELCLLNGPEQ